MIRLRIWVLLALTAALTSCERRPVAPVLQEGSGQAGSVVAQVGSNLITDKDLMERIQAVEKTFPRVYSTHIQKKQFLNELVNVELLFSEAMRRGLDKRFEFKTRLADLYVQQITEEARNQLSDERVKSFFESNREKYEQVSARHILFRFPDKISAAEKSALKEKLQSIRADLLHNPDKFADVARAQSDDSSRDSGGELGYFSRKMMVAPFSEEAFRLNKVGDISNVIESQFGYHLIQLTGDRRSFDNYKEVVKDEILRQTQRDLLDTEIKRLRAGKDIKIYEDNLVKLSPLPEEIKTGPETLLPKDLDQRKEKERRDQEDQAPKKNP